MTPRMVLQSTPDKPKPGGLGAGAKTREVEGNYWSRQVLEALHIHRLQQTSNLDCGLAINPSWLPLLNKPSPPKLLLLPHTNFPATLTTLIIIITSFPTILAPFDSH